MKHLFQLDPSITYLNHGSFGACPSSIFDEYIFWQKEMEKEPVQFITKKFPSALNASKVALAKVIGCDVADFFYVENPTFAINQVVNSLDLKVGDEVLTSDLEYGAMDKTFQYYAQKKGFIYKRQPILLPLMDKEEIVNQFFAGLTPNTKVVFISHITSATALILPVKEICAKAKSLGLITIVDGAHVPGHIDLDLRTLQADFYTGTLHKWLLAPKGASFLYVAKNFQSQLEPLIISWGYESGIANGNPFLEENEYIGTRVAAAFLVMPAIEDFFIKNNWLEKTAQCKQTILANYEDFCSLVGTVPICKISPDFLGQMCSIPIKTNHPQKVYDLLFEKYKIEIPVTQQNGIFFIRIAFQAYNTSADLALLKEAILDLKKDRFID